MPRSRRRTLASRGAACGGRQRGALAGPAQRSAAAAREIKDPIGAFADSVEAGAQPVHLAGSSMQGIAGRVQRVGDIIGEITVAADEQSRGQGLVSGAGGQLDQMTQQNAALGEQSSAVTESLRMQAERLSGAVGVLRLE